MNPSALLLWLTLFGGESSTAPSALVVQPPIVEKASAWFGAWLVGPRREPVVAQFAPVPGREELTGDLRFGEEPGAAAEHWIGRLDGGRLRLSYAGVGEGRLAATEDGRLVGRLSRKDESGELQLFRSREEARSRLALP